MVTTYYLFNRTKSSKIKAKIVQSNRRTKTKQGRFFFVFVPCFGDLKFLFVGCASGGKAGHVIGLFKTSLPISK